MRKIKFRAWDKQQSRMIVDKQEFIPLLVTSMGVFKLDPRLKGDRYIRMNDSRFELMQFTGLTDKNGADIYEGDIVSSDYYEPDFKESGPVVYNSIDMRFEVDAGEQDAFRYGNLTAIGNIHQNPELIK